MKVKVFICPLGCPLPENLLCKLHIPEKNELWPVNPPIRCPYTLNVSQSEEWELFDEYEVE